MRNHDQTRREFLLNISKAAAALAAAPLFAACGDATAPTEVSEDSPFSENPRDRMGSRRGWSSDLTLTTDEEPIVRAVRGQYDVLKALAEDGTRQLRIVFPSSRGQEVVRLHIVRGGAASYRHVRLVRESTGEVANLLWGREGVHPSIKLTDDAGRTLVRHGKPLEFSFGLVRRDGQGPQSWLELGIKIAAIALLVWLGASILKPIIAGIAFIAFNAMVIGIVVAGVAFLVGIVRWILDVTGWTMEDVAALFERTIDELRRFFREIINVLVR